MQIWDGKLMLHAIKDGNGPVDQIFATILHRQESRMFVRDRREQRYRLPQRVGFSYEWDRARVVGAMLETFRRAPRRSIDRPSPRANFLSCALAAGTSCHSVERVRQP